jgi:glycine/D-amino acid oxidase-like deaminating enzyme
VSYDVVIVGGGVMGSATAYHLTRAEPSLDVLVVEKDPTYERASTILSDGNVRIQFSLEENIRISQHTMEVLETFGADMATETYRPVVAAKHQGNLFLVDEPGRAAAQSGLQLQQRLGCDVIWLDATDISAAYPPYRSHTLVGGTFAPRDGSVDPTAVLRGYRNKAIEQGTEYLTAEADALLVGDGRAGGLQLASGERIEAGVVVLAAGAWSTQLAATAGVDLPVLPVMRTVYVVSSTIPAAGLPSVFLPSGLYAIPETDHTWLVAWSRSSDPEGFDFTPAGRQRFVDLIWPELVAHLPAFDQLHVERSWAGLYAVNTLDGNAIVGEWPERPGLYVVTGFSGHGFQQAPAMGRYLAELILEQPHQLDLVRLGPSRVLAGEPLHEHAGRII